MNDELKEKKKDMILELQNDIENMAETILHDDVMIKYFFYNLTLFIIGIIKE